MLWSIINNLRAALDTALDEIGNLSSLIDDLNDALCGSQRDMMNRDERIKEMEQEIERLRRQHHNSDDRYYEGLRDGRKEVVDIFSKYGYEVTTHDVAQRHKEKHLAAIKEWRILSGSNLKESKIAIDDAYAELGI